MTEPRFETMESAGLEDLLRRPDLPPEHRRAIQQELARRITGNITGTPVRPVPAAPPSPPVGMRLPDPGPPSTPPGPPAGSPPTGSPLPGSPPHGSAVPGHAAPHVPAGPPPRRPQPPARPRRKSGRSALGAVVAIVVVLAAAAGAAFYFLSEDDSPPPPRYGNTCFVADQGSCPLAQGLPVGTACTCVDALGAQYPGTVG